MKIHWNFVRICLLITLVVLMLVVSRVIAQQHLAATDSGILEANPSSGVSGEPDGAVQLQPVGTPQSPAASDSGMMTNGTTSSGNAPAPDENKPAASSSTSVHPETSSAVSSTFSYFQVAGATLRARNSTTTIAYDFTGCVHITGGSDLILNTELHIPDGALIKYIRLYYNDTSATGSVSAVLTRYTPGTTTTDLVSTGSTAAFTGGYGYVISTELNETVNNANYAYTLIGWPSSASSTLQICGIRVAYYAPLTLGSFLPSISR